MMELESLPKLAYLCLIIDAVLCQSVPPAQSAFYAQTTGPRKRVANATDLGTFIDVYGNGDEFHYAELAELVNESGPIRRITLKGLVLPDTLPDVWVNLTSLRTLVIDCAAGEADPASAAQPPPPPGGSSIAAGGIVGRFGSTAQLESLRDLISAKRDDANSTKIRNVSIVNCGVQGHYGEVWQRYLSDVQVVNLSGNALTGDFASITYFDKPCNSTFAGDDYGDPDCSETQSLDVSRNRLSGHISTGAALGDDVTDAICSTACISLVLAPGVTDVEVLCRAPLVIFALDNAGLTYRAGTRFGSGYVTRDPRNWCFMPASRWVLPTMWAIFLTLMLFTLAVTLYARVRLKRVPFRMRSGSFDVLPRSTTGSSGALIGRSPGLDAALAAAGGYVSLAGSVGSVELVECQAMIPKASASATARPSVERDFGDGSSSDTSGPLGFVSGTVLTPPGTLLPVPTAPGTPAAPTPALAAVPELPGAGSGGGNGVGGGGVSSSGRPSGSGLFGLLRLGRGKGDSNGIRISLTAGLEDSGHPHGGVAAAAAAATDPRSDPIGRKDVTPGMGAEYGSGANGSSANGSSAKDSCILTLEARAAAAAAGVRVAAGALGSGTGNEPSGWWPVIRAVLSRALEILGMQLRTLVILGMFGLECYWAYGLIRYRGGWQLLLLIPNYLEQTLAGTAMLRAFMAGTHGRWKYVAPVPLLPFTMSSVYLIFGFFAYPFGWADFGPISWEKFIDLMDSCGVLSSTCWAIFSSLAYWQGNSVKTSYQFFNTDIFVGMLLMCFTDLLSTAHHLASTLQVPFKQWLRRELDVRKIKAAPDKPQQLRGDGDL